VDGGRSFQLPFGGFRLLPLATIPSPGRGSLS
jgi:hypothetical protein